MKLYKSKEYLINETKTKSCSQIAKENNVNRSTIFRSLKSFSLTNPVKKWTPQEVNILKKGYSADRKLMGALKGRSLSGIYTKAFRLNISRLVKPLKYRINEDFFNIWSKEFAYFLGFFMAEGHINLRKKCLNIKLQRRDGYILNKFLKLFKTNSPLKYEQSYPTIKINNSLIIKRLIELGCKPSNSLNNSYPQHMPEKYFFHFLRGYIDGDGSIYICKSEKSRQKNVLRVTILGSKELLKFLIQKISNYLDKEINYKIIRVNLNCKNLYRVTFNGKLARDLCYKLYIQSEGLYLKRKKDKFDLHIKGLKCIN